MNKPDFSAEAEEARLRARLAANPFFSSASNLFQFLRWILIATVTGLVVGSVSTVFHFCLKYAVDFRHSHLWIAAFLPLAGLVIVFLYRRFHYENNAGTDTVIDSIHREAHIPLRMSFLIFVSTTLTVLFGGSVGREGAAMQIGGSIGEQLGELLRFNEKDKKIILMSGISAAFSALFGTPMAAAFLAMEIASIGIMYYAALVPCIWASLTAFLLARALNAPFDDLRIHVALDLNLISVLRVALLAILCALVSILFCRAMHAVKALYIRFFPNTYLRVFVGGLFVVTLAALLRTDDYLGPGMDIIEQALNGQAVPAAFLLKILFTSLTIGAGFKGGEIVPSFFVGATFGCLFAALTGSSAPLCAAIGMVAVFCGVTNCPITALLISFELFGFGQAYYYLIAVAVSYMLSGYYSLYHSQTIVYSKFENTYVNKRAE
ncbi:MAG: chloride channel protein [Eubacteriales bacterium]|nr:chloride channel protein [Eubacteriales bacterium]